MTNEAASLANQTAALAMSSGGPIQFDLIKNTIIKVASKIPTPGQTRYAKYRLTLKDGDLSELIPNDPRQRFSRARPRTPEPSR